MKIFSNRKGTILIATYMVLFVIIVVASSFFAYVVSNNKAIMRGNDGMKALNYAEKGIAYAYFESYNLGWSWYTHEWNGSKTKLNKVPPGQQTKLRTDCYFDADGFYVHNSGEFEIKAYPDLTRENDTIVVALGTSGSEQRAIMYYLTRRGIYDFFLYSPYTLDLRSAVGSYPALNGGGIHSNQDIYINNYMRLEDISELSAGENGNIYYTSSRYYAPYYADNFDGVMDGKSPITRLDRLNDVYRDDTVLQAGPWGYYNTQGQWCWKSTANYFVSDNINNWPTNSFSSTEGHFAGDSQSRYDVASGIKDPFTGVKNNSSGPLNRYNCWLKPYQLDADGNKIDTEWTQIPAELDQQWAWDKYAGNAYGTGSAKNEVPIQFYTFDDMGQPLDVKDSYWEIDKGDVVLLDPPADPVERAEYFAGHPGAKTYWDMFKSPEYWQVVRGDSVYAGLVNPEVLDGTYGDERPSGGRLLVKHTNSSKQSAAWKQFLKDSKLDGIVRDGNTGGEYLEPPDFAVSYQRLAEKDGIVIGLDPGFDGTYSDYDEWQDVLEKSIDAQVELMNEHISDAKDKVALKVKFINTFTGKWNVILEINVGNMQKAGTYPKNGILYTKVPLRLANASELAKAKPKYGFTVLGEENIYIKGDYNIDQWVTSAIISKKRVYTLSDNFNDPQVKPAPDLYPDYPYLYVKDVGGVYQEVAASQAGGIWVYRGYLDSDGIVDKIDWYPAIDDATEASLIQIIDQKNNSYRSTFNKEDDSGAITATWTWPATGESFTSGMMANKVQQDHTYNCLIAAYRWLDSSQANRGCVLENWHYHDGAASKSYKRIMNGAYFVLDSGGFTAANSEFVDFRNESGLGYDSRGRNAPNSLYSYAPFLHTYSPSTSLAYDEQFKTRTRSPSDVFFGGAESLWAETTVEFFEKMNFP